MAAILHNFKKHADCECCDATDTDIHLSTVGNMWQCVECRDKDIAAAARNKEVQAIIIESAKVDSSIQIKSDVFLAKSVAAIELHGAIMADSSIPDADKEYAFAKVCLDRFTHLKQVIFEERQALVAKENELRMWQVNAQTAAGKVREDKRAEFKSLDMTYDPKPGKAIAAAKSKSSPPATSKATSKKAIMQECIDAAAIYKIDASLLKMVVEGRKISVKEAAEVLVKMREDKLAASNQPTA